jgi:hypothetical protein
MSLQFQEPEAGIVTLESITDKELEIAEYGIIPNQVTVK